jgi:hypothetical protein
VVKPKAGADSIGLGFAPRGELVQRGTLTTKERTVDNWSAC